jgi:PAP2 superfamily protein
VYRRLYFFETLSIAQIVLVYVVIMFGGPAIAGMLTKNILISAITVVPITAAGVFVRYGVEAFRGRGRAFLRAINNRGWMTDTLRLIVGNSLLVGIYSAIKLVIPLYHERLFDLELLRIDRAIFAGHDPVIFLLDVFSNPKALRFFDAAYARIFFFSLQFAFVYFLSHPSRRLRMAFTDGNMVLWYAGVWLYLLLPSLGPAYVFPDIWMASRDALPDSNHLHRVLMINYQNMLALRLGATAPVTFYYGVAAFPSLHVGLQMFIFLWMRRLWLSAQVLFGILTLLILLGSMITGWHYLIDGVAGIALASICYAVAARKWRVNEWERLIKAVRR